MAAAQDATGSQTAVIDTEHDVKTYTASNVYVFSIETNNMVNGDVVEFRAYKKDQGSGTDREVLKQTYAHVQSANFVVFPPIYLPFGGKFTILQTAGTGRSFDWHVDTLE